MCSDWARMENMCGGEDREGTQRLWMVAEAETRRVRDSGTFCPQAALRGARRPLQGQ